MALPLALRRRHLLQGAGSLASLASLGLAATPSRAAIDPDAAFAAKSFDEALRTLGGMPQPTTQIALDLPALAENGAVVPIVVSSAVPGTLEILILVDGNPQPVAARFAIPAGTAPFVATRIKLANTCTVYATVRTDQGLFAVARGVEVVAGGCG